MALEWGEANSRAISKDGITGSHAGSNKSADPGTGSESGSVGTRTTEAIQPRGRLEAGLGTWEKEGLRMTAGLG